MAMPTVDLKDPNVHVVESIPQTASEESENALRSIGQRRINVIWEITQAAIAVAVTMGTIAAALIKIDAPVVFNAFFLVVGFYFSRTNHQTIGGITSGR